MLLSGVDSRWDIRGEEFEYRGAHVVLGSPLHSELELERCQLRDVLRIALFLPAIVAL